jgi:hypothetical protein
MRPARLSTILGQIRVTVQLDGKLVTTGDQTNNFKPAKLLSFMVPRD